jgi:hypothetical protein
MFSPAYSPELQRAEKLWPLVREAAENRFIDDLEQLGVDRCRVSSTHPQVISGQT